MQSFQLEQLEAFGLNLFFALLFFFIGMAIKDVVSKGDVPFYGKVAVWSVLALGCLGFFSKGIIQLFWESAGM